MGLRQAAWLMAIIGVAATVGCGKKVDCEQLCEREAECVAEIAIVLGTATKEQTALLKDEERKALGDRQRDRCRPNCMSPTKPSSVHSKWRKCLEHKDCESFARCVYR